MAHLGRVDIGDEAVFTATFRDADHELVNPTTVTFKIARPTLESSISSPNAAISNPSVGVWKYTYLIPNDTPGTWYVRIVGTGALNSAGEASFEVKDTNFVSP